MLTAYAVGMAHKEFPKWLYHHAEAPKIVNSQDELEALGDGWKTSPADLHTDEPPEPDADPAAAPAAVSTAAEALGRREDDGGDSEEDKDGDSEEDDGGEESDEEAATIEQKPPRGGRKRK